MDNNNYNNIKFDPMTGQPINQQTPNQTIENQSIMGMASQTSHPVMNDNQSSLQNQSTTNMYSQAQQPKKKVNQKLLIIIAAVVIVIVAGIIFVPKLFENKDDSKLIESLTNVNVFFLNNNSGYYALFDADGKRLTDFEFKYEPNFINGAAYVYNKQSNNGVIGVDGKKIIDYNEYKYLFEYGSLYVATDEEYNHFLLNSKGKKVRKLSKNEDVDKDYSYENFDKTYLVLKSDTQYTVFNYDGVEITKLPINTDSSERLYSKSSTDGRYLSIFYDKVNYIIDISKGKVLLTIPETRFFFVSDVNEKNSEEFILKTFEGIDAFKLVRNGKIIYSKETDIDYAKMQFEGDNILYYDDASYQIEYLLDENGNKTIRSNNYIAYKNYKNYVKGAEGVLNGAELYVNGILKEKFECNNIQGGYSKHGVYLLDSCKGYGNGDKIYINYDGTRINNKSYKYAEYFDENGYAVVSEDMKKYYLINLSGEKVSDYYIRNRTGDKIYNIDGTKDLYYGTNEDGTETIFSVNGEKKITGKIIYASISNEIKIKIVEKDNKYMIYDLNQEEIIATVDSKPELYRNYFTTTKNKKIQYYSYTTGKLFYEE